MKILIAYHATTEADNPFVRILSQSLCDAGYDVTCSLEEFWAGAVGYDIVHLQWPEELFGWKNPSPQQLEALTTVLQSLKQRGTPIVCTRHNTEPHHGAQSVMKAYRLFEKYTDVMVHMGEYSRREYLGTHPLSTQQHRIVPHHLYESLYPSIPSQQESRRRLGIDPNARVLLAFGAFRNSGERRLVWRAFRALNVRHKYLLAPRMLPFSLHPAHKTGIKRLIFKAIYCITQLLSPLFACRVVHAEALVDGNELPWYLSAADVVMIQRTRILNSGNLPLALLFGKVVAGPACGNLAEQLSATGNPSFDPADNTSVVAALEEAFKLAVADIGARNREYALTHWNGDRIAALYGTIYHDLHDTRRA